MDHPTGLQGLGQHIQSFRQHLVLKVCLLIAPMASQHQLSDSDAEVNVPPPKMPRMMAASAPHDLSDSEDDGAGIKLVRPEIDPVDAHLDLMPGLRDVARDQPLKMAEVFAGCGALSEAMGTRGFPTWSIDYAIGGSKHDFSSAPTADALAKMLASYHYVHFAPPCNTFSMARYPKLRTRVLNNVLTTNMFLLLLKNNSNGFR